MENNINNEFTDINKESKYKNYIIVVILYIMVIVLSIFLIIGVKNQNDVVKDNYDTESEKTKYDNHETHKPPIEDNGNKNIKEESNLNNYNGRYDTYKSDDKSNTSSNEDYSKILNEIG